VKKFVLEESKWYSSTELEVSFHGGDPRISFRDESDKELELVGLVDFETDQIHELVISHGIFPIDPERRNELRDRGVKGL